MFFKYLNCMKKGGLFLKKCKNILRKLKANKVYDTEMLLEKNQSIMANFKCFIFILSQR